MVLRSARPNSYIIAVVIPIPVKFKCIKLLFILMNLISFIMCFIELSIASYSAAAFAA